jgi:two-component system response regulator YesN
MYKIMIVDDESIIRKGLRDYICWQQYGFEVISEAENGIAALQLAREYKPDVILTDIYMPLMDGIEFSKKVKELLPEVIVIFISGYNDFSYAQRAIELGIYRYLTKPVKTQDLIAVLDEVAKELEHIQIQKNELKKINSLIKESMPILKERFLLNLVQGELKEKEIQNRSQYLGLDIKGSSFLSMVISLDDYFVYMEQKSEEDINIIKFGIHQLVEECFKEFIERFYLFVDRKDEIAVIGCSETEIGVHASNLFNNLQRLQENVKRYFKTTVSIGIGETYSNIEMTAKSYSEAQEALEYRTAHGKNSIIYIRDIRPSERFVPNENIYDKSGELIQMIRGGEKESCLTLVENMFIDLSKYEVIKKEDMHLFIIDLLSKLIKTVNEFGGNVQEVYGESFTRMTIFNFYTLEEVKLRFLELVKATVDYVGVKRKAVSRNFIEKAKDFIDENFAVRELNLNMVAESVHISPAYLSQLFKQVTGESCIEYITKARINESRRLLKDTNLKTYEIAEMVGYSDPQYFSTSFKKIVGTSPTNYRNMITTDIFD